MVIIRIVISNDLSRMEELIIMIKIFMMAMKMKMKMIAP